MKNIQSYGQRYENCPTSVLHEEMKRSRKTIYNYLQEHKEEFPMIDPREFQHK